MDLKVLKIDPVTNRISLSIQSSTVKGIDKLVQMVVLDLLSSEGSDLINQDIGVGIPGLVGINFDPDNMSELTAAIVSKVSKSQERIIVDQIGQDLSSEERLRSITVVGITPYEEESRLDLRLVIENELGRTRNVVI